MPRKSFASQPPFFLVTGCFPSFTIILVRVDYLPKGMDNGTSLLSSTIIIFNHSRLTSTIIIFNQPGKKMVACRLPGNGSTPPFGGARCSLGHHRGLLCLGGGRLGDGGKAAGRALVATFPAFVGSCCSRQKCWRIQRSRLKQPGKGAEIPSVKKHQKTGK